ncbi:hypothetical protein M7I_2530 [Glarea lozoyensis 74030]|uniref:Uncharacterized protein n=1 Tax=Glarea lozoyensis (strain ATCC 74030 / MF5533) TaxID=1104152 RepID=H0EJ07_GLAL7|nr:hypothetical protein M7I_2530 [Glarea lozoyensis 74030]
MSTSLPPREWTRPNLLISTKPELIQPQAIQAAFDSEFMYWAKPMSEDGLKRMLSNSLCFGLYNTSSPDKRE